MAKAFFSMVEEVIIEYEIRYDEERFKTTDALHNYLAEFHNGNPYLAMSCGDGVFDITHNQIIDYTHSNVETIEFY